MGNTKQIYFDGRIKLSDTSNPFFRDDIEDTLIDISRGDHCVLKIEKQGYLYLNKGEAFVIGAITTHSQSGFDIFGFLTKYLSDSSIIGRDADFSDIKVLENGQAIIYDPINLI